ncbi:MAG TPA: PAS domain S-box protein [Paucimonas sp.]|nr:PAS domain S-box protein [Paucimonas sp.]
MIGSTLTIRRALVMVVVLGLILPALLINGYSWFKRYDEDVKKQTHDLLTLNADILANGMQEPLWNINQESGGALLDAMMARNEDIIRIKVRDNALGVFVSGEHPERRVGYTESIERPVIYRGSTIGSIELEVGSTRLRKIMIDAMIAQMAALTAQVIVSIALILVLLEKRLVSPLQRLSKGAERLASRELDIPFTWTNLDEIGLLGRRLEDTRLSLRKLFEELDRKNHELELDIDKRKQIEQELHERERRFRALVEQSPIAIIEWDNNFRVIEWNTAAERIFGYTREQAIGRHGSFIDRGASSGSGNEIFNEFMLNSGDAHTINENIRADGKVIICQWSHTHISDETGQTGRLLSMAEDITERRRTEEAQRLSEAKFSSAFQCNPDPVTIALINEGTIIDVNQSFERVAGYRREEVAGKTALELQIWGDSEDRKRMIAQLLRDKLVRDFPWTMRTKYGNLRQCLTNATVFDVGNQHYMMAVIRDVTDQRQLEEQKAEADRALLRLAQGTQYLAGESFFELLVADLASALRVDCAVIGLRLPDQPHRIGTVAAHIRGRPVDNYEFSTLGAPCERTLTGDLCVFSTGIRTQFPRAQGLVDEGFDSYAGAPLRDAGGNVIGALEILHSEPLTNSDLVKSLLQVFSERASAEIERKRAEAELRSSEQRFSTIFESSPIALAVTEALGNRVLRNVNHAFEKLFVRSRNAVIGKNTEELNLYCNPADRDMLLTELGSDGADDRRHEIWMNRGDGSTVLVQFSGHSFEQEGERFNILAFEDVTDKRRIENEIRELNATLEERVVQRTEELQRANRELANALQTLNVAQEELVRSEKLAALGSLVAGVAHELNTPIGNSLMVASTLVDQTRLLTTNYQSGNGLKRSVLENYIADANKAGDILIRNLHRAANLVTSFKQVAVDQTSSQRRTFTLAEMVSEIMLTLWPTLKKTAYKVEQQIADGLVLDSYPGPLGQVIANLVNNALLHAFEGREAGTVTIRAQESGDGWIEMSVLDDGVGIPPANLNRIFDPFFTTKLGAGGSGLGLNITHNIVSGILGGRIRVQSEVGVGTTFILNLPTVAPQRQGDELSMAAKTVTS